VDDGSWRRVHSDRDPLAEASRWVAQHEGTPLTAGLVCIVGAGYGYILDLLEQQAAPSTKILVLEPEAELLEQSLMRRDWTTLIEAGRLMMIAGPAYEDRTEAWRMLGGNAAPPVVLHHPVIAEIRPDAALEAAQVIRQAVSGARANAEARQRFGGRYLLNTLRNLSSLSHARDVNALFGAHKGQPAIVAAAGPSLNRNLLELSQIPGWRERAVFVAVDTALKPALAAGLHPHYVVGVDPGGANARKLSDLPPAPETALVAEPSLDPYSFEAFVDRTYVFKVSDTHHPWPWLNAGGLNVDKLRAWGSVLTTAFDFALRLGCDPIVFIGADLAYTNGQPHCRNSIYEKEWAAAMAHGATSSTVWQYQLPNTTPTRDRSGNLTPSSEALIAFRDWLVVQTSRETTGRFINATGAGILFGPRIEDNTLASVLVDAPPVVKPPVVAPAPQRLSVLDAARRLLADPPGASPQPMADWLEFAAGAASEAEVRAAVAQGIGRPEPGKLTALTTLSPTLPSAAQWTEERRYWRARLLDLYASRYGIAGLHRIQDNDATVPPRELVALVQSPHMGTPDGFWGSSFRGACCYLEELHDHGFDPRRMERILDFGVGLGRLLVNYLPFNAQLFGCDVTPQVAAHSAGLFAKLASIVPSGFTPPLPYPDASFDFVYANSVFTHIPGADQDAWIAEIARVTRPGGCVIASAIDLNVHYGGPPAQLDALVRPHGWFDLEPESGVKMGFLATDATLRRLWAKQFDVREIRHHFTEQLHLVCVR
jgi:SAM-dependent methyltransferase